MKLGIALIVIGGGDILLSIALVIMGYVLGVMGAVRLMVDVTLLVYGIGRVIKAKKRGATQ